MYMYVHTYIYICIYIYIYIHVCMYICIYVHMYICIYVCMYWCICIIFFLYSWAWFYNPRATLRIYIYIYTYVNIDIHNQFLERRSVHSLLHCVCTHPLYPARSLSTTHSSVYDFTCVAHSYHWLNFNYSPVQRPYYYQYRQCCR